MRRKMVGLLAAALILSVSVMSVSAHGHKHKGGYHRAAVCSSYVDADGDGVCESEDNKSENQ